MNKLRIFAVALAVMTMARVAQAAANTPTMTITDGGVTSTFFETAPGSGKVIGTYSDTSWNVVISSGQTKPLSGSATSPNMTLMVQATRNGAGSANAITIT